MGELGGGGGVSIPRSTKAHKIVRAPLAPKFIVPHHPPSVWAGLTALCGAPAVQASQKLPRASLLRRPCAIRFVSRCGPRVWAVLGLASSGFRQGLEAVLIGAPQPHSAFSPLHLCSGRDPLGSSSAKATSPSGGWGVGQGCA